MTKRTYTKRRRVAALTLSTLALPAVAAACGSAPAPGPQPGVLSSARPGSRALALGDAAHLLASLPWPAGWPKPSPAIPPRFPAMLRGPALEPLTPYLVDVSEYALVPGTPAGALATIAGHLPAGATTGLHGETSGPRGEVWELGLRFASSERLPQRSLLVQVATAGPKTAVRVDAQVVFRPDKPSSEVVPAGVVRARIVVTPGSGPGRTFEVASPMAIGELVATVDALARPSVTVNPGGPNISLSDTRRAATIDFFGEGSGQLLAVVVDHPALAALGTGNVRFEIGTRVEPVLEDTSGSLASVVRALTGVSP